MRRVRLTTLVAIALSAALVVSMTVLHRERRLSNEERRELSRLRLSRITAAADGSQEIVGRTDANGPGSVSDAVRLDEFARAEVSLTPVVVTAHDPFQFKLLVRNGTALRLVTLHIEVCNPAVKDDTPPAAWREVEIACGIDPGKQAELDVTVPRFAIKPGARWFVVLRDATGIPLQTARDTAARSRAD